MSASFYVQLTYRPTEVQDNGQRKQSCKAQQYRPVVPAITFASEMCCISKEPQAYEDDCNSKEGPGYTTCDI